MHHPLLFNEIYSMLQTVQNTTDKNNKIIYFYKRKKSF